MFIGVLGMAYAPAGRLADARRLALELDDRQSRGEYIVPLARLALDLGFNDVSGIRGSLAACAEAGASPTSVIVLIRQLIEAPGADGEIARLLDRLHDAAGPKVIVTGAPAPAAPRDPPR